MEIEIAIKREHITVYQEILYFLHSRTLSALARGDALRAEEGRGEASASVGQGDGLSRRHLEWEKTSDISLCRYSTVVLSSLCYLYNDRADGGEGRGYRADQEEPERN